MIHEFDIIAKYLAKFENLNNYFMEKTFYIVKLLGET